MLHKAFFNCVESNSRLFGLALLKFVIGWQISRHFFNQWEAKRKPIVPRSHAFFRAWHCLNVLASSADWFNLIVYLCYDWPGWLLGFGLTTLNWKYSIKPGDELRLHSWIPEKVSGIILRWLYIASALHSTDRLVTFWSNPPQVGQIHFPQSKGGIKKESVSKTH